VKILLRPRLCGHALAHRLAADPQLAKALGAERNAAVGFLFKKFFDADGPALPQVLAHARAEGERLSFLRDLQFTPAEVAGASHLEVVCRKTIAQSDAESRATLDDYGADSLHPTAGRWQVRLPQRVFLNKAVPAETIAHVDQYTGEYVEASADFARTAEPWCDWSTPLWVVRQRVRTWYDGAGLRGWAFWPVLREGTALYAEHEGKWREVLARVREAGAEVSA